MRNFQLSIFNFQLNEIPTKIDIELAHVRKSWQYLVSKCVAVFACFVAIAVLVDFFYDNQEYTIKTPTIAAQLQAVSPSDYDAELKIAGSTFRFGAHWTLILLQSQQLQVCSTRWFGQAKYVYIDSVRGESAHVVNHASIYNDAIILWAALLLFGMRVFFPFRRNFAQLIITRYYNLLIVPFLCIFVLGNGRLQHAIGVLF
ncbi:MAG: hypothetical protein LBM68_01600 [Bacteroidales bacterium]|jgi:hypothetical protein|nr:hypothetical protein [Bacteroidales bacterium]